MDMNKLAQKAATKEQKLVEDATGGMLHRLNVVLGDDSKLNPTQRIALANGLERLLYEVEMGRNVPLSLGSSAPASAEAATENSTTTPTPASTPQSAPAANPAEAARIKESEEALKRFVGTVDGATVVPHGTVPGATDFDATFKSVTDAHDRKVKEEITKASKPDTHIEKAKVWAAVQKVQPHLLDGGEGFHNALLGNKSISKENLDKLRGTFGVVENMVKPAGA